MTRFLSRRNRSKDIFCSNRKVFVDVENDVLEERFASFNKDDVQKKERVGFAVNETMTDVDRSCFSSFNRQIDSSENDESWFEIFLEDFPLWLFEVAKEKAWILLFFFFSQWMKSIERQWVEASIHRRSPSRNAKEDFFLFLFCWTSRLSKVKPEDHEELFRERSRGGRSDSRCRLLGLDKATVRVTNLRDLFLQSGQVSRVFLGKKQDVETTQERYRMCLRFRFWSLNSASGMGQRRFRTFSQSWNRLKKVQPDRTGRSRNSTGPGRQVHRSFNARPRPAKNRRKPVETGENRTGLIHQYTGAEPVPVFRFGHSWGLESIH